MAAIAIDALGVGGALFAVQAATGWTVPTGLVSLVGMVYFGCLEGWTGRTIGDRLVHIAVLDVQTGERIGVRRGLARYGFRYLSVLLLGIPAILGLRRLTRDPAASTPWDRRCGTIVVELGSTERFAQELVRRRTGPPASVPPG